MNNIFTIRIILSISFSLLFYSKIYTQARGTNLENDGGIVVNANGDTRVAQWKDDKIAAFSLNFDDSMPSHVENAIPVLKARGLTGTFYVNPGKSRHQINEQFWQNLLNEGQAMAPHTMNHNGASSYEEAVYEIGESAKYVWDLYGVPHFSELQAYASGGGVTWTGLTEEQRREIEDSFLMINRYHYKTSEPHWHSDRLPRSKGGNTSASSLISFFNHSVSEGKWEAVLFHGVGGGWISIDLDEFITFVDYLETKKDTVWIDPWINVYKYDMERFSAQIQVLQSTNDIIELRLSSDIAASGFITHDVNLYNEPLTLVTQVPWINVTVTQGSSSKTYTANNGEVMYEALPNVGTTIRSDIVLQQSNVLAVDSTSNVKIPNGINLEQNYPNPFNPTTNIKYQIANDSFVSINIYNTLGEKVTTLINEFKTAGSYEVEFSTGGGDVSELPSGIYVYTIAVEDYVQSKKMLLLK